MSRYCFKKNLFYKSQWLVKYSTLQIRMSLSQSISRSVKAKLLFRNLAELVIRIVWSEFTREYEFTFAGVFFQGRVLSFIRYLVTLR